MATRTASETAGCCPSPGGDPLSQDDAADLAATFKALADPTRVRLLSLVASSAGAEACVCDLTEPVGLSQPTVSHHLRILVDAGLLTRSKRGVWSYYAVVPGALEAIASALSSVQDAAPA